MQRQAICVGGVICDALLYWRVHGRAVDQSERDAATVVRELVRCGGVCRDWRRSQLRRLVRVLLDGFQPAERAAAAVVVGRVWCASVTGALALVRCNGVVPLFALAQCVARGPDLAPLPPTTTTTTTTTEEAGASGGGDAPTMLAMASAGVEALAALQGLCCSVVASAQRRNDSDMEFSLLAELPQLMAPQWVPRERRVRWPVTIVEHHCSAGFCPPVHDDVTVLDEYFEGAPDEESGAVPQEQLRQLVRGPWAGLRGHRCTEWDRSQPLGAHLLSWNNTAMAALLALRVGGNPQPPPSPSAPLLRVLLIGLGGGALAAFIACHFGSTVALDVVEESQLVVEAAKGPFGLHGHAEGRTCENRVFSDLSAGLALETKDSAVWEMFGTDSDSSSDEAAMNEHTPAHMQHPDTAPVAATQTSSNAINIHVEEATRFVKHRVRQLREGSADGRGAHRLLYDVILVDALTSENVCQLSPTLLGAEFFTNARALLRASGGAGVLAVNAGKTAPAVMTAVTGAHVDDSVPVIVERLRSCADEQTRKMAPPEPAQRVDVLVEQFWEDEEQSEVEYGKNCVVVGWYGNGTDAVLPSIDVKAWEKMRADQETADESTSAGESDRTAAPLLPVRRFELLLLGLNSV
jgi:hypothetical protein